MRKAVGPIHLDDIQVDVAAHADLVAALDDAERVAAEVAMDHSHLIVVCRWPDGECSGH